MSANTTTKTTPAAPKVDAFGTRLGTKFAAANAALAAAKKPLKMSEVLERAGLNDTVYNHLNGLVKKGLLAKSAEGYAVKAAKKAKAPRKSKKAETPAAA